MIIIIKLLGNYNLIMHQEMIIKGRLWINDSVKTTYMYTGE